jgi:8-oxo-dGTP pyrophosphatase MutT (NUDIX family)
MGAKNESLSRVRCVLMRGDRYLLAQHNSRRPEKIGRWGLPGGRLKSPEKPRAALRRELVEELRLEVPYLVEIGDWLLRGQTHRVFGCEIDRPVGWFDTDEILGIGWFSYDDVTALDGTDQLHTGYELGAIRAFRDHIRLGVSLDPDYRVDFAGRSPRRDRSARRVSLPANLRR